MLHTFSHGIVRTLSDGNPVHIVKFSTNSRDRITDIFPQKLLPSQQLHQHAEGLLREDLIILVGCFVSFLGNEVQISWRAKIRQASSSSSLAQVSADSIHRQRNLNMQCTIQIGIAPNREGFIWVEIDQPITNKWSLGEQVASCATVHLIVIRAILLALSQRKGDGTARLLGSFDQALPDERSVQVDRDNVGAELHENFERSHGRARPEQNEVLITKIDPRWVVSTFDDSLSSTGLDGPVVNPAFDLRFELFS
mmetsp:Transcript_2150/g.5130  ORF Transcript_2150/g.5130 Transcript_2150/m.5130 type:complete len:253 (-) Transcript_2150:1298-2056(-)